MTTSSSARIAWFATAGAQTPRDRPAPAVALRPPDVVEAVRGRGQVTVAWAPVDGAIGYLVHRASSEAGPFAPIDQHTGDVLAVPNSPYLDTTGPSGEDAWYAVSSVATIEAEGVLSRPVLSRPGQSDGAVSISVAADRVVGPIPRPWRPIVGSEHLALLRRKDGPGGSNVGAELAEAFRIVHRELGVESVRAHAILDDSLGVVSNSGAGLVHAFAGVDDVLDRLLATGLRPVVELSFMPRALASDPDATVFDYRGIISPPRDDDAWATLVKDLVGHLIERFGRDEVRRWPFEVWNEPNLGLFWSAAESDYLRLYEVTARAVKAVDPALLVGGPATAAAGWIDDLLAYCAERDVPIDFVTTHTYGMAPLDLRPILDRFGRSDLALWWTEWGVSSNHGAPINDSAWAAPLVARGMRSAAGRIGALAYWVASDHFIELGAAPTLFHGGFGLLTIGNLRKPRFWALAILDRLAEDELACVVGGDGGGSLVEAWASCGPDGRIAIAIWSGTLDQSRADGDRALDRALSVAIDGLPAGNYQLRHHRVDADHSNIVRAWEALGRPDWPDASSWDQLRAADHLEELEPVQAITVGDNRRFDLRFDLPMPSVSLIELVPG